MKMIEQLLKQCKSFKFWARHGCDTDSPSAVSQPRKRTKAVSKPIRRTRKNTKNKP